MPALQNSLVASVQSYGKEYDTMHGLNQYDYHAHQRDPALGRFTTMDPHAESYYSWSPYAYCANNPLRIIDPDGKDWWDKLQDAVVGTVVGAVTNVIPGTTSLRDAYTPNDAGTYNRALQTMDNGAEVEVLALAQLNQSKENSINSVSTFSDFLGGLKDISIYYNYSSEMMDKLAEIGGNDMPKEISTELKGLAGMASVAYISFDKGEITTDSKVLFANDDVKKKYDEIQKSTLTNIKGDQLQYLSSNPLLAATLGVKGEGIKSYLAKIGIWKLIEDECDEEAVKIGESILNSLNGDISFSLGNFITVKKEYESWDGTMNSYDSQFVEMSFFADCKDGKAITSLLKEKLVDPFTITEAPYTADSVVTTTPDIAIAAVEDEDYDDYDNLADIA